MEEVVRKRITTPDAWMGADLQNDPSWIYHVSPDHAEEIDVALRHAQSMTGGRIPFGPEAFPLPTFASELERLVDDVANGRGFSLIRGIPRERYTDAECETIYWGLVSHFGRPVSQNARGHLLGHVTDEGKTLSDPNARGYQTKNKLDFHCDQLPVDMLGLFCLRGAKSGGESYLVSATNVHNIILEERPDLLDALYEEINIDWRGDQPTGAQPWYRVPMFSSRDGKVTSRFTNRSFLHSVTRFGEKLAMTERQNEAFELAQEIAHRPEVQLWMNFREGDIQFVNNHTTLHARSEYEDFDEPERKRHLLRLWIALPDKMRRPLSPRLDERYRFVVEGGIPKREAA